MGSLKVQGADAAWRVGGGRSPEDQRVTGLILHSAQDTRLRVWALYLKKKNFFFFAFFLVFIGLHPWHIEVPRLGVESEL